MAAVFGALSAVSFRMQIGHVERRRKALEAVAARESSATVVPPAAWLYNAQLRVQEEDLEIVIATGNQRSARTVFSVPNLAWKGGNVKIATHKAVGTILWGQHKLGTPEFQQVYAMLGDQPERIAEVLTPEVEEALLRLSEKVAYATVELAPGKGLQVSIPVFQNEPELVELLEVGRILLRRCKTL